MSRSKIYFFILLCSLCVLGTMQEKSCFCKYQCDFSNRFIQNDTCRKENVALGKAAQMSAQFNDQYWYGQSGPACLANNGNMDRDYLSVSQSGGPSCIHSQSASGWWKVDLRRNYTISSIVIFGRNESPKRMPTSVTVNGQTCYQSQQTEETEIHIDSQTIIGRFVNVYRNSSEEFLNLCQVQVWVDQCSCFTDNQTACSPEGHCRMENVALGKVAYMSSVYGEETNLTADQVCVAVDGSPGLNDNSTIPSSNCIMSSIADDYPWWEVDLGQEYIINKITVYTLHNYLDNMKGVEISVDGQTCYTFSNTTQPNNVTDVKCSQARKGKLVTFTSTANKQLVLCEIRVWACMVGFYGEDCAEVCGKCDNATCDVENGSCPSGCELGFAGLLCKGCDESHYGSNCTLQCGHCFNSTCDSDDGHCEDGCEAGWWNITCHEACPYGFYGRNCEEICGHCFNSTTCDPVSGTCVEGCIHGFTGYLCKTCSWGLYSENCTEECGKCKNNATCDTVNGTCSTDCENGFADPLCKVCDATHYGSNCTYQCGHCLNGTCNNEDGHCEHGCEAGWRNITCHQVCPFGFYGHNCKETCGHCLNSSTCNPANGTCVEGCINGYDGHLCKECAQGYYGNESTCIPCGKCINGSACNNITGYCDDCEKGWHKPLCNVCDDKHYDSNCSSECGHCFNNECNKLNGTCNYGCEAGWWNSTCEDECLVGFYGRNCEKTCGRCLNSSDCDPVNGSCAESCLPGSTGTFCSELSNDNNGDVAGIVGGVIAAVVLALMIIVIVIFIRRRHRDKAPNMQTDDAALNNDKMSSSITTDKSALISPIGVQGEDNLRNSRPSESLYASIENSSAPLYGNLPSPTTSSNESKHLSIGDSQKTSRDINNGDFEMSLVTPKGTNKSRGQIYENVVVPASAERPLVSTKRADDCQSIDTQQDIDTILGESDVIYNNENIYSTFEPLDAAFQLDSLQCSLLASLGCGQLSKQFQDLPKGMIHPHTIGLKQENLKKNRFKALCPYDKNRVKLNRSKDDNDNDYINASYIKGHQRDRAYIAAQGPREHTVDDMWLMIWQENISQIVMLTNIKEEGKDKCAEYWPSKNTTQTYGHVSVTGANEETRANFVIRTFSLKFKGKPIQRQVDQYHYVTWPDHGVPAVPALVSFWRFVHERAVQTVPLLVHCSAGIGRSGTYIALDIAMEMASNGSEVNVHKIVTDLREDRISMVQTESQYRFLHEVVLEAYSSRSTGMNLEQFEVKVTGPVNAHNPNTFIDTEFKMLQQMGEFLPKPSVSMATDQENLGKTRNMNALPDDKYLAYLGVPVEGRNSYINAVFLSSFRHHRGILLTQLPLPETLVDIWRLVDNKDVKTIVSIESKNDHKTIKNYCHYWPKTGRQDMTTGPYRILMSSSTAVTKHLTSYNLSLKTENKTRDVHLLHYTNWTSEIPEDTSCVIQLVQILNKGHLDKDDSPVLVQCIDGAAKSGLFCVVWNVISRLSCDQEIDVYLTSRDVQTVRRQAVTSEVQYRYCYQVAQDYLHSGVYQNT